MRTVPWTELPRKPAEDLFRPFRAFYGPGRAFVLHDHTFPEIFWIEGGNCLHRVNGHEQILNTGDLFLIRSTDAHEFRPSGNEGFLIVNIPVRIDVFEGFKKRYFDGEPLFYGGAQPSPAFYTLSHSQLLVLQTAFEELRSGAQTLYEIDRFLLNLFHLIRAIGRIRNRPPLPDWLERACELIKKPENFGAGTPRFAKLAGRCPGHVSRETKRLLSVSPTDIVNEARLEYCARELAASDKPILDLVTDCGFESVGHFYALFRKKYRMSPRQYRVHQQQSIMDP